MIKKVLVAVFSLIDAILLYSMIGYYVKGSSQPLFIGADHKTFSWGFFVIAIIYTFFFLLDTVVLIILIIKLNKKPIADESN